MSLFSSSKTNDSNTFENNGVHDKFLSSERPAGELFFGITLTVSDFQSSGHSRVDKVWLKIKVKGTAS